MSDLKGSPRDQRRPPTSRFGPENRPGRDRNRAGSDLLLLSLALVVGCARPGPAVVPEEVHRAALWVDAFSPGDGDGSEAHPLKHLPAQLPQNATVHVRSGLYAGPFTCEGAHVVGHGEVVLTGESAAATVRARACTLEGLSVQGGQLGVEAHDGTRLLRVRLSGQRRAGVQVVGTTRLEDVTVVASVEGIDGVVAQGAALTATKLTLTGGLRRGVQLEGGRASLREVRAESVKTVVHAMRAATTVVGVDARGGSGPALFFAGGQATVREVRVRGHEYGLQLARDADVTASELDVAGTAQACVSAVQATLKVDGARLTRCGLTAGLFTLGAKVTASGLEVTQTPDVGVLVRDGEATLTKVTISNVSRTGDALGDALHLRACRATLDAVRVSDVAGSALFASAGAEVTAGGLDVERAHDAALFVERSSTVQAERVLVRGGDGPAVLVPDRATVKLGALSVAGGNELPIYAECAEGAVVSVTRLESTVAQLPSRCVRRGGSPGSGE